MSDDFEPEDADAIPSATGISLVGASSWPARSQRRRLPTPVLAVGSVSDLVNDQRR
jgi:hypothetical protein